MTTEPKPERLVDQRVTYTLLKDDQFYIIENVPARVNEETGEQFFAPQTVEHLRQIIAGNRQPRRMMQTPVYEFAQHCPLPHTAEVLREATQIKNIWVPYGA